MKCPACDIENEDYVDACECGYRFDGKNTIPTVEYREKIQTPKREANSYRAIYWLIAFPVGLVLTMSFTSAWARLAIILSIVFIWFAVNARIKAIKNENDET